AVDILFPETLGRIPHTLRRGRVAFDVGDIQVRFAGTRRARHGSRLEILDDVVLASPPVWQLALPGRRCPVTELDGEPRLEQVGRLHEMSIPGDDLLVRKQGHRGTLLIAVELQRMIVY